MTLRLRLFLVFGALLALLIAAQALFLRALTDDLVEEVDRVAVTVGRSVASVFATKAGQGGDSESDGQSDGQSDGDAADGAHQAIVIHLEVDGEVEGEIDGDLATGGPGDRPGRRIVREIVRRSPDRPVRIERIVHDGAEESAFHFEIEHEVLSGTEHGEHGERGDGPQRMLWLERPDLEALVPIPHRGLDERLAALRRDMLLASLGLLLIGLLVVAVVARRVAAPLQRLADASAAVGAGALGTRVEVDAPDREVRSVLEAFNAMSARLAALDAETRRLAGHRHLADLGEVARGLAHSLRNPLNALGLTVDELLERARRYQTEGESDPGIGQTAATARRQIRRLDRSIRSFLALASRDDPGLEPRPVDLGALVDDVALEALQDAGGRVRVEVTPPEAEVVPVEAADQTLRAVPAELRAAVQALVVNAVEASPDGGLVTLRLRPASTGDGRSDSESGGESGGDGERFRLTIDDEGPGIAPALRDRLFSPHTTTKPHGAGMGLFLAHRLAVHRYQGSLLLEDREPTGTRAILTLGDRLDAGEVDR